MGQPCGFYLSVCDGLSAARGISCGVAALSSVKGVSECSCGNPSASTRPGSAPSTMRAGNRVHPAAIAIANMKRCILNLVTPSLTELVMCDCVHAWHTRSLLFEAWTRWTSSHDRVVEVARRAQRPRRIEIEGLLDVVALSASRAACPDTKFSTHTHEFTNHVLKSPECTMVPDTVQILL